jgi:hypothetical protein
MLIDEVKYIEFDGWYLFFISNILEEIIGITMSYFCLLGPSQLGILVMSL